MRELELLIDDRMERMCVKSAGTLGILLALGCGPEDVSVESPRGEIPLRGPLEAPLVGEGTVEGSLEIEVFEPPDDLLARVVQVQVADGDRVDMVCRDDGTVGDEFVLWDTSAGTDRQLLIAGLASETAYTCTLTSGGVVDSIEFATASLPSEFPETQVVGGANMDGAYTLYDRLVWEKDSWNALGHHLYIVDPAGRVRWYLDLADANIDVDATVVAPDRLLYGGALSLVPTWVGLDHQVLSDFESDEVFHHHVEPIAGDRILTLTQIDNTDGATTWDGFEVSIRDGLTLDKTWSWSSQVGFDAGVLPVGTSDGDPYHANAAQILWNGDQPELVLVSLRNVNRIIAIDASKGDVAWSLGRDGDFMLVDDSGIPLDDDQWFETQHAIELDWPRLRMFDNGPLKPRADGTQTRALELELDVKARTVRPTWTWADGPWREGLGGDVDRLPSGNVLVTIPHCLPCSSATPEARSAIVEVTELGDEVWRLEFPDERDLLYRAQRLDGCAIFQNRAFCPTL